jgi:hypothetical protein
MKNQILAKFYRIRMYIVFTAIIIICLIASGGLKKKAQTVVDNHYSAVNELIERELGQ